MTSLYVKAIIVAYKPDLDSLLCNLAILDSIQELKTTLFLNLASTHDISMINEFIESRALNIDFIYSRTNEGLSRPYNKCSKSCVQDKSCSGVLFLDQDSFYERSSLHQFISRFLFFDDLYPLGIFSGIPVDPRTSYPYRLQLSPSRLPNLDRDLIFTKGACSSMSIVSRRAFLSCGFFDDRFFIDLIDYEFSIRVFSSGLYILADSSFKFDHPVGEGSFSYPLIEPNQFHLLFVTTIKFEIYSFSHSLVFIVQQDFHMN